MTDPEQTTPPKAPPLPPQRTLHILGMQRAEPAPLPAWRQLPFFALLPLASFFSIVMMNTGVPQAMLGAGLIAGIYWLAFLRLNPRMVGLALIPIILVPYYAWTDKLPDGIYPTLWMAAAALAGGVGALLTRRDALEDDMIFIPPLACALAFVVLVWLGTGAQTDASVAWAHEKLKALPVEMADQARSAPELGMATPEYLETLQALTPLNLTIMLTIIWALSMWLFGRLARRVAGFAEGSRTALILFRLTPRYIFLLIAGLALGILGSLPGCGGWLYVAYPLLATLAMAFVFQGAGVALFFAALRRTAGDKNGGLLLLVLTVSSILFFPGILALVGLLDHWMDFRKLNRIATLQMDRNE